MLISETSAAALSVDSFSCQGLPIPALQFVPLYNHALLTITTHSMPSKRSAARVFYYSCNKRDSLAILITFIFLFTAKKYR